MAFFFSSLFFLSVCIQHYMAGPNMAFSIERMLLCYLVFSSDDCIKFSPKGFSKFRINADLDIFFVRCVCIAFNHETYIIILVRFFSIVKEHCNINFNIF